MAVYDVGDTVTLGVTITNSAGVPANASAVTATITLPDGTTTTPSVTNSGAGLYDIAYSPTQVGRYAIKWLATGTNASAYADVFEVRDFSQIGVVSLDEVKAHLNIPSTDTTLDEELRRFMDAATDLAENYTGIILGQRTFTDETYDGQNEFLRIINPKVISIISVVENGLTLNSNQYFMDHTGQRLYRIGSGTLYSSNSYGYWAPGIQNIKVTYKAGFINPPSAIRQGVLEIIRHLWQTQRGAMNVMGRNIEGDQMYSAPTYSLPRRAMELLDPASLPGLA